MNVTHTTITEAADITDEILTAAEEISNGWYEDRRIDWDDFIDRLDGMELEDGTRLDLGTNMLSPAIEKIKAHIRKYRRL